MKSLTILFAVFCFTTSNAQMNRDSFNKLPKEKQAEIMKMREKVRKMSPAEREKFFKDNNIDPSQFRRGRR